MNTGPTSIAGKLNSSRNSYKHGVYSKQVRLRDDEKPDFELFQKELLTELQPDGPLQAEVFTRLLRTLWTIRRLDRREDDVFCSTGLPLAAAEPKEFENTLRYRRFLAKEHRDLLAELRRLQTEAAVRFLGTDYQAFRILSPLVEVRPLVKLENERCAARNNGRPLIAFSPPNKEAA